MGLTEDPGFHNDWNVEEVRTGLFGNVVFLEICGAFISNRFDVTAKRPGASTE